MNRDSEGLPPPLGLALVVADHIWRDPGTKKRTILGTFSAIASPEFPVSHPILAVYGALTEGYGKIRVGIRIVPVEDDGSPIAEQLGEVDFTDPLAVVEIDAHFLDVLIPAPGEYRVQLWADDALVLERRLVAVLVGSEGMGDDQDNA